MGRKGKDEKGKAVSPSGRDVPEYVARRDTDEVDLASEDSFPASDPPSFTSVSHTGKPTKDGGTVKRGG